MDRRLGEIISDSQNTFVEDRQILDTVLAEYEIVDDLVTNRKEGIICKLDMEKAYDYISWSFVDYMLERFGLGSKWRLWMHTYMTTTSFVVLIYGGPSEFLTASRDLRQGDPLSPLLFILVMEALDGLSNKAREQQLFKCVLVVTTLHLMFPISYLRMTL